VSDARDSVPDPSQRIMLSDRLLVEWVAAAKPGDAFPEPWCHAPAPLRAIVRQLVGLGVIAQPAPGASHAEIARVASAAAPGWLQAHPPHQGPGLWRDVIGRPPDAPLAGDRQT
jgi:hypothetical protein